MSAPTSTTRAIKERQHAMTRTINPNVTIVSRVIIALAALTLLSLVGVASASAAVEWGISVRHGDEHIAPNGPGQYAVTIENDGDTASSGVVTLTSDLPDGVVATSAGSDITFLGVWDCSGTSFPTPPGGTVTCSLSTAIQPEQSFYFFDGIGPTAKIDVTGPPAQGTGLFEATVSGGGAAMPATADVETAFDNLAPGFGIRDGSFVADVFQGPELDAPVERQAGSHPFEARTGFDMNLRHVDDPARAYSPSMPRFTEPPRSFRDAQVQLPMGFVGNPQAAPQCPASLLNTFEVNPYAPACPANSQVGIARAEFSVGAGLTHASRIPVFNVVPPRGTVAAVAFALGNQPVLVTFSLDPADGYSIIASSEDISAILPVRSFDLKLWGVPGDSVHDPLRNDFATGGFGAPSGSAREPFLTLPSDCDSTDNTEIDVSSLENPVASDHEETTPTGVQGCESQVFDATLDAAPTTTEADSPSGLSVDLEVPQNLDPDSLGTPPLRKAVVTLPEGMSLNPAAADGLEGCSEAEIGLETNNPVGCPNGSKIGSVEMQTPLLPDPVKGAIYQAEQGNKPGLGSNPFGSMLALYVVLEDKDRGLLIKLPAKVEPDPETGRLVTTFDENPQMPFSDFHFEFKSGPRAPLATPRECGTYEVTSQMRSWNSEIPVVSDTSSFKITSGPHGSPCPDSLADRPLGPKMKAGVMSAVAGSYSPFVFQLTREDGDQEILSTTVNPPKGLTAKLAGVPYCPEPNIAAGTCPDASRIGTEITGAGAGSTPFYTTQNPGSVYLAGPYKGAPLSMVIEDPVMAGPFDLENITVRSAIHVDPRTAQLTVVSDPIPQIVDGIPLRIRDLRIRMDRPKFTIAPTNCDPMSVGATVQGSHGATANLTNRFQVGDCASLGFSPKLKLDFGNSKKSTKRNQHPPLKATLAFNEGDANISHVKVALPEGVFLDQERIGKVCSREAYAASSCPAESQVGYAKATTPLLDQPVEGPVYLKASDNVLPDLAADLNGQIDVDLFGMIDQRKGKRVARIQNTFDVVPDVPVSSFELTLSGGSDGLLVNSKNICSSKRTQKVSIDMVAHNEMTLSENPLIGSACKSINKKKAKKLKRKAKKLLAKAKKADSRKKAKKLRKQARKLKRQARKLGR